MSTWEGSPSEQSCVIQEFHYPDSGIISPDFFTAWQTDRATASKPLPPVDQNADCRRPEQGADELSMVEKLRSEFGRGRTVGFAEGQAAAGAELSAELRTIETEKIEQAARLDEQFAREREHYMKSIEPEVVRLAIAIASLILRREVQIDPLLLTGSLRIALREVAANTSTKIRVPASTADLWLETIDHLPNLSVKPTVVPDERLQNGDCVLETEMGSADLAVKSQLAEISRLMLDHPIGSGKPHASALSMGEAVQP